MSFMDAREHGSKPGAGAVSANQEVRPGALQHPLPDLALVTRRCRPPTAMTGCACIHSPGTHWWCRIQSPATDSPMTSERRQWTGGSACGAWRWRPLTWPRTPTFSGITWVRCGVRFVWADSRLGARRDRGVALGARRTVRGEIVRSRSALNPRCVAGAMLGPGPSVPTPSPLPAPGRRLSAGCATRCTPMKATTWRTPKASGTSRTWPSERRTRRRSSRPRRRRSAVWR